MADEPSNLDPASAVDPAANPTPDAPWYDNFSDPALKDLVAKKGYGGPEEVANAYRNALRMNSGAENVVELPGADADEATLDKFHAKLGRPEAPENYTFEVKDNAPIDEQFMAQAKTMFHKAGLNDRQAKIIADEWQDYIAGRMAEVETAQRTSAEEAIDGLKKAAGRDWDAQVAAGNRAVKDLGLSTEALNALDEAMGVPATLELLTKLGAKIGKEGNFRSGTPSPMSKGEASEKIAQLSADKDFAAKLKNPQHPEHEQAKRRWEELHQRAHSAT